MTRTCAQAAAGAQRPDQGTNESSDVKTLGALHGPERRVAAPDGSLLGSIWGGDSPGSAERRVPRRRQAQPLRVVGRRAVGTSAGVTEMAEAATA